MAICEDEDNIKIMRYLLAKGVSLEFQYARRQTAFHVASREGHVEIVRFLLDKGVALEIQNVSGLTALHLASREGHVEIVKLLLEQGVSLEYQNVWRETALHLASRNGHIEIVKLLLAHADERGVYKADEEEKALAYGAEFGSVEIVTLFLKRGVDCYREDQYGSSCLHLPLVQEILRL